MRVYEGDRVEILVGDEKGSWGIVKQIAHGFYHVGIAGGADSRIFERSEIRKSRALIVSHTPVFRVRGIDTDVAEALDYAHED